MTLAQLADLAIARRMDPSHVPLPPPDVTWPVAMWQALMGAWAVVRGCV